MSRKKANFNNNNTFQTPFSLMQNLTGSVDNLSDVVNSLSFTSDLLKAANKETIRQGQATRCEQTHELVTDLDIEHARRDVSVDIIPECEQLINAAQKQLDSLLAEETMLSSRVDEQERTLKDMKRESMQSQRTVETPTKKRRLESNASRMNDTELQAKKRELLDLIKAQDETNTALRLEIDEIKLSNMQISTQMENMQSSQEIENREKSLENELIELERQVVEKQNEVAEKKKAQKSTEQETSDTEPNIQESISQYSSHLEFIQNVLHDLCQPEFVATTPTIHNCELQCKKYLQALQKEKIYIQMNEKQKQGLSNIEQIKLLCKNELSFKLGKTTAKLIDLVLSNKDFKISVNKLLEEFPAKDEQRHNLTTVTLNLLQANILKISGTDLITNM